MYILGNPLREKAFMKTWNTVMDHSADIHIIIRASSRRNHFGGGGGGELLEMGVALYIILYNCPKFWVGTPPPPPMKP